MKKFTVITLFSLILLILQGCETVEEENGKNIPLDLVAQWELFDFQIGFEIMTNSSQNLIDFSTRGVGIGLNINGDNRNENLTYINPMFMFFDMMEDSNDHMDNDNDEDPNFLFAAQNLDWSAFTKPEDFIGEQLKMFLLFEDHEHDYYHDGTMVDTTIVRAVYFEWVINDTSDFFMGDKPPDSLYIAEESVDFTFDESTHELTLNNLTLYFARIEILEDTDSTYRDTVYWDSTRTVVASGNLAPATISVSANTPTIVATPFFNDEMEDGPPQIVDLHDDGTVDLVETYWECDEFDNCNEITEYPTGEWWTEGTDSLIIAIEYPGEGIDTIDLQYLVSSTDLALVFKEFPCEDIEDEFFTEEQCMEEIEHMLIGLQEGSLSSVEMIMNIQYKKNNTLGRIVMYPAKRKLSIKTRASRWAHNLTHFPMH